MDITIAGPGAGKTTNLAKKVISDCNQKPEYKWFFILTYTNTARDIIKKEISKQSSNQFSKINISTIHSFFLSEVIFPFYHFLYKDRIVRAISVELPSSPAAKNSRLTLLRKNGFIENSEVFKQARYIIVGKNEDKKAFKPIRDRILKNLASYIDSIYIDEAQDIDEDVVEILQALENNKINIHLIGDPKQDIRGHKAYRKLINLQNPQYISDNYRCPKKHVDFMNIFVEPEEIQVCKSMVEGRLEYVFGNLIDISKIMSQPWDLIYIVKKNEIFNTQKNREEIDPFYALIFLIVKEIEDEDYEKVFFKIINQINRKNFPTSNHLIGFLKSYYSNRLTSSHMGMIKQYYKDYKKPVTPTAKHLFTVPTIDSTKGKEGGQCLFIFTTYFIKYLLDPTKEFNKPKSQLYVALSRSTNLLTLLLDNEVVRRYGEKKLEDVLLPYGFVNSTLKYR